MYPGQRFLWAAACVGAACVGLMVAPAMADTPAQQPQKLEVQVPVTLNYLLYLPSDYDEQQAWPLVIFLHGAGERGDDLELVKKHGPPKLIEEGKQYPAIVVSPQCPSGEWWSSKPLELMALVDAIVEKYRVDSDRVYLTGLSMGGYGTWMLAAYAPERFAAIVPICGGGESLSARALRAMPVWAFHGAKDAVVPLKRSEDMVEALKRTGNQQAKLTVYPDVNHDSWTETYNNPEVFEWLFSQRRPASDAKQP